MDSFYKGSQLTEDVKQLWKEKSIVNTFKFKWKSEIDNSVEIEADTLEEAYDKWQLKKYGDVDIEHEELTDDIVRINGEDYDNSILKRV